MAVLMAASAFFSCSEAALFYLGREARERMARGGAGQRAATALLDRPERLLTSILFWNLVINMSYFSLQSVVTVGLQERGAAQQSAVFWVATLLTMIVISEMLPKNLGVLWPRQLAGLLGLPLSVATRVLDPILPTLQRVSNVCERLVAPEFVGEPYLELADLEKAITIGGSDPALVEQEQNILSRIVALSEVRVEEVMRPRKHYLAFAPPVTSDDLNGQTTPSGYLLIAEPDSDEIAAALPMQQAALLPPGARLDYHASPVALTPWCATAAATLGELQRLGRRVAAVLNELGETIGIVTVEDLLSEVLQPEPAPRHPDDRPGKLTDLGDGVFSATGRTTLRRLSRRLGRELPTTRTITVGGLLQELLQRMPATGDSVEWGGFVWTVTEAEEASSVVVEFRLSEPAPGEASTSNGRGGADS